MVSGYLPDSLNDNKQGSPEKSIQDTELEPSVEVRRKIKFKAKEG